MTKPISRYWVFAGDSCYPHCGIESLVDTFSDSDEAIQFAEGMDDSVKSKIHGNELCDPCDSVTPPEWWQVVDTETATIIKDKRSWMTKMEEGPTYVENG